MVEQVLAGIGLAVSLGLLGWMLLGPARRERLRRSAHPRALRETLARGLHCRRHRRAAQTEALEAIERARRRTAVDRDGNVYRPRSFDRSSRDGGPQRDDGGR